MMSKTEGTITEWEAAVSRLRENLKRLRGACGYSQPEIAQRLGVSLNTVSNFERGQFMSKENLRKAEELVRELQAELDRHMTERRGWEQDSSKQPELQVKYCDYRCPACGEIVPGPNQGFAFCGACGSVIAVTCPECRRPSPLGTYYCAWCGAPLRSDAPRKEHELDQAESASAEDE